MEDVVQKGDRTCQDVAGERCSGQYWLMRMMQGFIGLCPGMCTVNETGLKSSMGKGKLRRSMVCLIVWWVMVRWDTECRW